jgi:hypothetical protein
MAIWRQAKDTEDNRITLYPTGARPVRFNPDKWPLLVEARGDNYQGGADDARKAQEWAAGHFARFHLAIRYHKQDGRVLVYGARETVLDEWRGAHVLPSSVGIEDTIRGFGAETKAPQHVINACLAALPPLDLDGD